MTGRRKETN